MTRMTRTVRDVPDSQVNFMVAMMEDDGAKVTKISQGGRLWTIIGTFPDAPGFAGTLHAAGPPRRGQESTGAPVSLTQDVDILARTVWGEARGGSRLGMEAVAAVVLNRLRRNKPERFGSTIADVCLKPKQFSCWNPGDPNLQKLKSVDDSDLVFRACIDIAERAVRSELEDPTMGSDHYHAIQVTPEWANGRPHVRIIDSHVFYNNIA